MNECKDWRAGALPAPIAVAVSGIEHLSDLEAHLVATTSASKDNAHGDLRRNLSTEVTSMQIVAKGSAMSHSWTRPQFGRDCGKAEPQPQSIAVVSVRVLEISGKLVASPGIDSRARRVAHFRRVDTTRCLRSHRGHGERIEPLQASSFARANARQQRKRLASLIRSSRGTTDARFSRCEGYGANAARSP